MEDAASSNEKGSETASFQNESRVIWVYNRSVRSPKLKLGRAPPVLWLVLIRESVGALVFGCLLHKNLIIFAAVNEVL